MSGTTVAAVFLSFLAAAKGAPAGQCCNEKTVGETVYSLVREGDTAQYGCLQNCIYQDMDNQGSMFCFSSGDLPVECLDDNQGNTGQPQEEGTPSPQGDCKCGVKNKPRIVGGKETEINEFPWMGALKSEGQFFCGGTLVASKWVLSASHCLYKDQELTIEKPANEIEVVLGDHDYSVEDETDMTKTIQLDSYIKHPKWNENLDFDADIAMLKLAEEVDLNVFTPACLAKTGEIFVGMKAWAYGWGGLNPAATEYPDKLMKVELPIVSDEQCESEMKEKGWDNPITEGMLCAGGVAGEDSCGGDSGGPLTVEVEGQHVLVGDTSYGHQDGCAQEGFYGVYAETAVYREWVDATMENDGPPKMCTA